MTYPQQLSAVFFDFDGVVADSLEVKKQAFATLFAPYGEQVQNAAVHYHVSHGGMPRHSKMRHCLEELAGQTASEEELANMVQAFARLVFQGVVSAPLLPGVATTLKDLQQVGIPAFVVSGTPEKEMQDIVRHKQLAPYFQGVYGSPRQKSEIVNEVLQDYTLTPGCCLFIGDALADWQAAKTCGLIFLGIVPPGHDNIFPQGVITSPDPGAHRWPQLLGQDFAIA